MPQLAQKFQISSMSFWCLQFSQKTNENNSRYHSCKVENLVSFFSESHYHYYNWVKKCNKVVQVHQLKIIFKFLVSFYVAKYFLPPTKYLVPSLTYKFIKMNFSCLRCINYPIFRQKHRKNNIGYG